MEHNHEPPRGLCVPGPWDLPRASVGRRWSPRSRTLLRLARRGDEGPSRDAGLRRRHLHRHRSGEAGLPGHDRRRSGSATYCQVVHRSKCPTSATSCTTSVGTPAAAATRSTKPRRYLVIRRACLQPHPHRRYRQTPGNRSCTRSSSREEIVARRQDLTGPAHRPLPRRRPDDDLHARATRKGDGPGGFLLLDQDFEIDGRWDNSPDGMKFNYDFWYQPRQNVMVSSEWAAPNTVKPGFKLEDVKAGKYGHRLQFWDWERSASPRPSTWATTAWSPSKSASITIPKALTDLSARRCPAPSGTGTGTATSGRPRRSSQVDPVGGRRVAFPVPGLITDIGALPG